MTQYCRYCTWLSVGREIYCNAKHEPKTEVYAKRPNKCKRFDFADVPPDLQDAFMENERGYKPRNAREDDGDVD